jgi:hypothetical protein
MNILGRHVLFWRKPGVEVSRFATVLPRLRAIREECDWQPLTNASATEQRRERVQDARRRIIYRPVPYDRSLEWRLPLRRTWWLWLACGLAVLCAVALIWAWAATDRASRTISHGFSYQLPSAPPFLAEGLALEKAKESLSKVVSDPDAWRPSDNPAKKGTFAPDGTRDMYFFRMDPNNGLLFFENTQRADERWSVSVMLHLNGVHCTVSRTH